MSICIGKVVARNVRPNATVTHGGFHIVAVQRVQKGEVVVKKSSKELPGQLSQAHLEIERLQVRVEELRALLKVGVEVVEDFMPNIGRCALQDYGRLNDFLNDSAKEVGANV